MDEPASRDAELDTLLLHAIDEYGALSMTRAKEFTKEEDSDRIVKAFARLILNGRIIWVPGLPRQGVFFTRVANKKAYGLPLMSRAGHSARGWTRKETSVKVKQLLEVLGGYDGLTINEIAKELDWGRDTVARHLAKLEARGKVFSEVIHDGQKGRPPIGWSLVREEPPEDGLEVDFTNAAKGPRRRRRRR